MKHSTTAIYKALLQMALRMVAIERYIQYTADNSKNVRLAL